MKILILGASGLVGWNLFHAAQSLGHTATGTYRTHPLPGLLPLKVEEDASLSRLFYQLQPDAVFFCAGWSWVDGCQGDPDRAYRENVAHPARTAQLAAELGAHFTYFSTSYVFDGHAGPYAEDDQTSPISVYGSAKLAGEAAVTKATGGTALIARTMGVYGPEPQRKNFVFQVRQALAAGKPMRIPNDQFGNVTHADDLARMALVLAEQERSGIWNLAGPDANVRRSDFARQIAQSYGLDANLIEPVETASLNQPAPRPRQGGLLVDKVSAAVSFSPRPWVRIE